MPRKESSNQKTVMRNASASKRVDPDHIHQQRPASPPPKPYEGPVGKARVAKGRTVHIPTGKIVVVGEARQRADAVTGIIVGENKPVTREEVYAAGPGQIVELPLPEIERLTQLGFLEPESKAITSAQGKAQLDEWDRVHGSKQ